MPRYAALPLQFCVSQELPLLEQSRGMIQGLKPIPLRPTTNGSAAPLLLTAGKALLPS